MKKIAIIFGGASVEHDVSVLTGLQAIENLKEKYIIVPIYLSLNNKFYVTKFLKPKDYEDKNNVLKKSQQICFFDGKIYKACKNKLKKYEEVDAVLNCCHGGIGENGMLKAFMDINNIKLSSAGTFASGVCMNKYITKLLVESLQIPVVKSVLINSNNIQQKINKICEEFSDNLIIKPNCLGSSIGVFKTNKSNLKSDIEKVLHIDKTALVEECVENLEEINCAVLKNNDELCVSLIEKVSASKDFLSFEDKYCKKESIREIPAKIDEDLKELIYSYSKTIYRELDLDGVIRIDYLYDSVNKKLYMNEVNTVPGSLAFYLYQGLGIDYTMMAEILLKNASFIEKQTYFDSDILSKTGLKIK